MLSKTKRTKINKEATASIWYIASNLISRGAGFLFTPVFTRLLSPGEYGIYSLYTGFMGIFTVICSFEISGSAAYRTVAKFDCSGGAEFASSALGAEFLLTCAALTVYIIFRSKINAITSLGTALTVFLVLQVFFNTVEGIYFVKKRYFGNYRETAYVNIISGVFSPILSLIFIYLGFGGISRIIGPLTVSGIISAFLIYSLISDEKRLYSKKIWHFLFRMSIPMLPHYLSLSLIAQSDKIIIARILGDGALGKYSAAYSIGFMLSLVTSGLSFALTPWTMRKLEEARTAAVRETVGAVTRLVCLATLLFAAVLPETFSLFAAKEYTEAIPVAYIVGASVIFTFSAGILSNGLLHCEKPIIITKNSFICAALSIALGILLVKRFGYIGGAFTTLIISMLHFGMNYSSLKRISGIKMLDLGESLGTYLFMAVFTVLIFSLRYSLPARIILIFALALMLIRELKKYKRLMI